MIATGGVSAAFASAMSATHNNAINAGYGGSQAFDNDDGSAYYDTYDNFFCMYPRLTARTTRKPTLVPNQPSTAAARTP